MVTIKGINAHGEGVFIIHYEVPSPCLCSFTRHTKVVYQKRKPTPAQAVKLINNETADETND